MIVGVVAEIKPQENRVGLVPSGSKQLVAAGHTVLVQRGAGRGSSLPDEDYAAAGAQLVDDAAGVWSRAELIVKVKEIMPQEYALLRPDHILFPNLHCAAPPAPLHHLLAVGLPAIPPAGTPARGPRHRQPSHL